MTKAAKTGFVTAALSVLALIVIMYTRRQGVVVAVPPPVANADLLNISFPFRFEQDNYDFGVIHGYNGNRSLHVSALNKANRSIHVRSVTAGCGCIVAKLASPSLTAPGSNALLDVSADTQKMFPGKHSYPIYMRDESDVVVGKTTVSYDYRPFFDFNGTLIKLRPGHNPSIATAEMLFRVPAGDGVKTRATLEGTAGGSLSLLNKGTSADGCSDEFELNLSIPLAEVISGQNCQVNFVTDDPRIGEVKSSLPIRVDVSEFIRAMPGSLLLGNISQDKSLKRTIYLAGPLATQDLQVESSSSAIQCNIVNKDEHWAILVEIRPAALGNLSESVRIEHPDGIGFDIPVTAYVASEEAAR